MANNNVIDFLSIKRSGTSRTRIVPSRLYDARTAKGFNQSEVALQVGISRQAISAYEQGEKTPEAETMSRIAKVLGQPISFFTTEDQPLFGNNTIRFYRAFGVNTKRRNLMCDVYSKWLVQVACFFDKKVNYPPVALPIISPANENGRYSDEEIEAAAELCRKEWGLGLGPISNVISLLESRGIATCRLTMINQKIDAFSFWNGTRPFIFLATEKESSSRARFDTAHELGHLILHRWIDNEELEAPKTLKLIEKEANRFAGAFLLPRSSFPNEVYTPRLDAFVELKKRWKVGIQAMVYRCKDLAILDEDQVTNLYKQISARKWRMKEPLDNEIALEEPKLLHRAVELLIDNNKLTPDELCITLNYNPSIIEEICNLQSGSLSSKNVEEYNPTLR